jgi:hypothetical protein
LNWKTEREAFASSGFSWRRAWLLVFLAAVECAGCGTAGRLPPVDLSAPGWSVRQGQAVWKPPGRRPEIAGDLLVATNANGDFLIQFSKVPFSIAMAEDVGGRWRIQFGANQYDRSGRGAPPGRLAWFQLPRALAGSATGPRWNFQRRPDGGWRLENAPGGESLEGRFFP